MQYKSCGDRKIHICESLPLKVSRHLPDVLNPGHGDDRTSIKFIGSPSNHGTGRRRIEMLGVEDLSYILLETSTCYRTFIAFATIELFAIIFISEISSSSTRQQIAQVGTKKEEIGIGKVNGRKRKRQSKADFYRGDALANHKDRKFEEADLL